jgi:hypothetical protein
MPEKRYWFTKKSRGWGWTPCTREGWIAIAIFLIVNFAGIAFLIPAVKPPLGWIVPAWVAGCTAVFLVVVIAKGEPLG